MHRLVLAIALVACSRTPVAPPPVAPAPAPVQPAPKLDPDQPVAIQYPYGSPMCVHYADGTIGQVVTWHGSGRVARSNPWRSEFRVRAVSCQTYQLCFIRDDDGGVDCVGRDHPTKVSTRLLVVPDAVTIATTRGHNICVTTKTGDVRCTDTIDYQGKPHNTTQGHFKAMGPLRAIIEGTDCAVTLANELKCITQYQDDQKQWTWGPTLVLANVRQASLVTNGWIPYGCAVLVSGRVSCWGPNKYGEVGNGARGQAGPVEVSGVPDAISVNVSGTHACVLTRGREVFCWGASVGPDGRAAKAAVPQCKSRTIKHPPPPPCPRVPEGADDVCGRMRWNADRRGGHIVDEIIYERTATCVVPGEEFVARPVRITTVRDPIFLATMRTTTGVVQGDGRIVEWSGDVVAEPYRIPKSISDRPL